MKKLGLTTQIFIAMLLGAITGGILYYFVPDSTFKTDILTNGVFYLVGNGFLRCMQMLVVPLVFFSLICGAMSIGDTKKLGSVGIKTIGFYLVTTAVAITIALGVASIINPGIGLDLSTVEIASTTVAASQSTWDTLLNIIPTNPVASLSNGTMLQIIFFALMFGTVLATLGEKVEMIAKFCEQFNAIMMQMTVFVMKIAPIGVFCLIAKTFVELGFEAFIPMLKYMGSVILVLAIQCFIVYMILLKVFAKQNPLTFLRKFSPVMGFAFSTSTSNATIPMSIETLSTKLGVSKRISSFTIPLGATINMDGTAIMQGVAVIFTAQAFGIELGMAELLTVIFTATMASIGTAGVPGVGLITLSMVFASVGLPLEGIGIIMGIDRILDMTRTAVNITGDAVCTMIIAQQEGAITELEEIEELDAITA
ncbi:MAG: sodium:dicarboxylate symporter [Epulopiscium sp. Nele67-Bin002]|nr:MAG: sodium:dicarboxylate symporter [Epulopiscium sp. Nuni2H_MBin001]OON90191.1 MAG: sodium:dicarboxylate symporter [Epulopiscium sp. Nele67-Bin001]OON92463.1 MAG: sodium:dicarboxylate symporter [Epulopiscium sp. Nele67-Bin002]